MKNLNLFVTLIFVSTSLVSNDYPNVEILRIYHQESFFIPSNLEQSCSPKCFKIGAPII